MPTSTVQTPDGRTLALHEGGDPSGVPVVVHHGTPSSGLLYEPWSESAAALGIRLIGFDRAGYGASDRAAGRDVAHAAGEVTAIADALGLERLATWGISGGGPHALACAALCDGRLVAAASLAGVAPYRAEGLDWLAGMGDENVEEFGLVREGEQALRPFLERHRREVASASPAALVEVFGSLVGPADAAVLSGRFAEWTLATDRAGLADGTDGWLDDDVAFASDWGFDPGAIRRPVLVVQGGDDRFVPPSHGRWLADHVAGAEAWLDEADGHLTLIERRVPEVHEWLRARF